jgi:chromosome segregation ATPase
MTRSRKALALLLLTCLGTWGCGLGSSGEAERLKALQVRHAQLEEDFRAVVGDRDRFRREAAALHQQRARLESELAVLQSERDELQQRLQLCTSERDLLAGQYDQFRAHLRDLLGQAEAARKQVRSEAVTAVPSADGGGTPTN